MKVTYVLLCVLGGAAFATLPTATAADTEWRIGEPIVTYWAGPASHNELNDITAAQLAAGGWNMGWADTVAQLDIYYRYGIRGMFSIGVPDLDDPAVASALDEKIAQVRDHPALYAYYLTDEPGAAAFAKLGKVVAYLRERDPAHVAYINLYPTYANNEQLGIEGDTVTAYREYLRQFVDIVRPDLLSYDHYHFKKNGDGGQYFLNLALMREAALKAGVPFVNIIQACAFNPGWRTPTAHELRWLTYTSLAYGAQGISHFVYNCRLCRKSGFFRDCPESEVPLPIYWAASRINRDFVAVAEELQPLNSLGAYHVGNVPQGGQPLPPDSHFTVTALANPPDILLGCFGKSAGHPSHVLVVNLDYNNPVTTHLKGPGLLEVFHAPTRTWAPSPTGSTAKLDLPPGGGTLVRLVKQT